MAAAGGHASPPGPSASLLLSYLLPGILLNRPRHRGLRRNVISFPYVLIKSHIFEVGDVMTVTCAHRRGSHQSRRGQHSLRLARSRRVCMRMSVCVCAPVCARACVCACACVRRTLRSVLSAGSRRTAALLTTSATLHTHPEQDSSLTRKTVPSSEPSPLPRSAPCF